MTSQAPRLRSLYRQFLRELPLPSATQSAGAQNASVAHSFSTRSKPSLLSHRSPIAARIRSSFADLDSSSSSTLRLQEAEQFIQYLKAQRQYTTLLERYNPGANMDEEERVRLTARRVGMEMPVEFEVKPWGAGGEGGENR